MLTNEDHEEGKKLVGYCDHCDEWWNFIDDPENPKSRRHPACGGEYSKRIGFQLTTQRTFNASAKKLSKAAQKKMSMVA